MIATRTPVAMRRRMSLEPGLTGIARRLDARRRVDAATWSARVPVLERQLAEQRAALGPGAARAVAPETESELRLAHGDR